MKKQLLFVIGAVVCFIGCPPANKDSGPAAVTPLLIQSFEGGDLLAAPVKLVWGGAATTITNVASHSTEGTHSLQIDTNMCYPQSGILYNYTDRIGQNATSSNINLSKYSKITIDVDFPVPTKADLQIYFKLEINGNTSGGGWMPSDFDIQSNTITGSASSQVVTFDVPSNTVIDLQRFALQINSPNPDSDPGNNLTLYIDNVVLK